jgi:hypothetical protein
MEEELSLIIMAESTRANGRMTKDMDEDSRSSLLAILIMASTIWARQMGKGFILGRMEKSMMGSSLKE